MVHRNVLTKYYSIVEDDWYHYWHTPTQMEISPYKQSMVSTIDFPETTDGIFASSGIGGNFYVSFEGYLHFTSSGPGSSKYSICLRSSSHDSRSKMYLNGERIIETYSHPDNCVHNMFLEGLKKAKVVILDVPRRLDELYLPSPSLELTWQNASTSGPRHFDGSEWLKVSNNMSFLENYSHLQ